MVGILNFDSSVCCKSKWCILTHRVAVPPPLPLGGLRLNCGEHLTVAEKPFHGYKIAIGYALR